MTKLTKKEKFAILRGIVEIHGGSHLEMLTDFIDHEVELLNRKNSGEKKPTANQIANDALRMSIVSEMEPCVLYSCTDIIKRLPCCEGLTPQKVSPLMNRLVTDGFVEKTIDKRKVYFSVK